MPFPSQSQQNEVFQYEDKSYQYKYSLDKDMTVVVPHTWQIVFILKHLPGNLGPVSI